MKKLLGVLVALGIMVGVFGGGGLEPAAAAGSTGRVLQWNVWDLVNSLDSHIPSHRRHLDAVIFHDNDPYTPDFAAAKCITWGSPASACRYLNVTAVYYLQPNSGGSGIGPFDARVYSGEISKGGAPKTTTTISPVTSPPGWQAIVIGIKVDACWWPGGDDGDTCALDMLGSLWG